MDYVKIAKAVPPERTIVSCTGKSFPWISPIIYALGMIAPNNASKIAIHEDFYKKLEQESYIGKDKWLRFYAGNDKRRFEIEAVSDSTLERGQMVLTSDKEDINALIIYTEDKI